MNTFTQSLTTANTGLGQFSGSIGDLAKSLLLGGAGGSGGIASGIGSLFSGFAEGGLIKGSGTGTSDSNLALVSDGEFIVSADKTKGNMALLQAINEGRLPKLTNAMAANISHSLVHSPTINVTMNGGDREAANTVVRGVTKALHDARPDTFKRSHGQMLAHAQFHLERAGIRHG